MSKSPSTLPYPPTSGGTSLVDRMNISIHLRKYFKLFARRWWILLLCIVAATGQAVYKANTTPDVFQSSSRLGIAPRVLTGYETPSQYQEVLDHYYDNQMEYMRSIKGRVERGLADYRKADGKPPGFVMAEASKGNGSTFLMVVQSDDYEYARRYAVAWPREFIKFKEELKSTTIDNKVNSIRQEVLRYEQTLAKTRSEMSDFRKEHNINSALDEGRAAQKRLDDLKAEHLAVQTRLKLLENKTVEEIDAEGFLDKDKTVDKKAAKKPGDTGSAEDVYGSDSDYNQLKLTTKRREADYQDLLVTLKPKHPYMLKLQDDMRELQRTIKFKEDQIAEQKRARLEQIRQQKEERLESLRRDEKSYLPLLEQLAEEVRKSGNTQSEYDRLQKEETQSEQSLDAKRKELDATLQMNTSEEQITTMEEGEGTPLAIGPERKKMIINGFFMGFGVGIAVIFLLHRLDDRLELAEDIEDELGEPVLGQVPQQDTTELKEGRLLITQLQQHNMFVESIRGVRSAVMFGTQGKRKQVMIVTSAVPGDGKTTFTVNFAATLANAGTRVLLVDADLRRGNVHHYFEYSREPGLSEVLGGQLHWSDAVRETTIKTLHVITSGQLPGNPGELLISPVTREFIEEARREYDHILFDCPPLTAIDDTFCLLSLVDGLLFIVKAGQTSMRFAKNALASVRQRGAEIIGVVLNGITTDHPSYYYNYYYHAYYNKDLTASTTANRVDPAQKMAQRRRNKIPSIDAEAHARAGQPASSSIIAAEEQKKVELFKARRAMNRQPAGDNQGERKPASPTPATNPDEPGQG